MVASLRKADVLFAVSALSEGYFDNNEDRRVYMQLVEEYFVESRNEMEADTENENGMCRIPRILIIFFI